MIVKNEETTQIPTDDKWIKYDINSGAFIQPQEIKCVKIGFYIQRDVLVNYAREKWSDTLWFTLMRCLETPQLRDRKYQQQPPWTRKRAIL